MTPTNSTLEVHSLMWCPFPPHLWQICLGHRWLKRLLSPQTKHLLSFRARRPPRMMRIGVVASLMLLRCSAPDQAFLVRRLERCASRPVTLPRRSSPVAAGAVPCSTWDMVIISDSSFTLRSPIAVFDPPSHLHAICCRFFGAWGANRLAQTLECS